MTLIQLTECNISKVKDAIYHDHPISCSSNRSNQFSLNSREWGGRLGQPLATIWNQLEAPLAPGWPERLEEGLSCARLRRSVLWQEGEWHRDHEDRQQESNKKVLDWEPGWVASGEKSRLSRNTGGSSIRLLQDHTLPTYQDDFLPGKVACF